MTYKMQNQNDPLIAISQTLQRMAPPMPSPQAMEDNTTSYIWQNYNGSFLHPIQDMPYVALDQLKGLELQKKQLWENTYAFGRGLCANNALLWGARGMGKSSLVKSVVVDVNQKLTQIPPHKNASIKLIELPTKQLDSLETLIEYLRSTPHQCIIFCDDLSFDHDDGTYRSLKSSLDGGLRGWPKNILIYATSNRRHLMARSMKENEEQDEIHPSETTEEKVSLSDRFGLWLGFHACDQNLFDDIILANAQREKLPITKDKLLALAHEWSITRGGRSGRIAKQFLIALRQQLNAGKSST